MRVHQLACDRFEIELPAPEPDYVPLADRDELSALVRKLWTWGRTPLLAVVAGDAGWCGAWPARPSSWMPEDVEAGRTEIVWQVGAQGTIVVLSTEQDLFMFLLSCPDVSRVALFWPRIDAQKSVLRLALGQEWKPAVEAYARLSRQGSLIMLEEIP